MSETPRADLEIGGTMRTPTLHTERDAFTRVDGPPDIHEERPRHVSRRAVLEALNAPKGAAVAQRTAPKFRAANIRGAVGLELSFKVGDRVEVLRIPAGGLYFDEAVGRARDLVVMFAFTGMTSARIAAGGASPGTVNHHETVTGEILRALEEFRALESLASEK